MHLIFMVAWFVGLFYLIRLYVYHIEAMDKPEVEARILTQQYTIMERRLFTIIMRPAMIMTWVFGVSLIYLRGMEWFSENYWLHAKLLLVFLLSGYTDHAGRWIDKLEQGIRVLNPQQMRLYNEVPTLFLVTIILLAVYKNLINFGYTLIGIFLFAIVLVLLTKMYRRIRLKNNK